MKKIILILLTLVIAVSFILPNPVDAAKKGGGKKSSISKEDMEKITTSVDDYTRRVYSNSLFSPKDMQNLVDIKIKLDDQMLATPAPELAPLYYKIGNVYKARGYNDDAIECFQTILENFADTALAPKARKKLQDLGVEIKAPESPIDGATPKTSSLINTKPRIETVDIIQI